MDITGLKEATTQNMIKYIYTGSINDVKIRHEHGLRRIIRRRYMPRYKTIYNSPTQVRDRRVGLTKVLQKFKFAKFRFLIFLQSSNFG